MSSYKIKAQIDEHYIDRIHQGLTATLDRQGEIFELQIMKVYQEVVGGTFEVDLRFQGSMPQNIRTGQAYHINLELGRTRRIDTGKFRWIFQQYRWAVDLCC